MKIPPETLAVLKALINPLDTAERRGRYLAGDFPRAAQVQDLNKRYRWDLLYAAKQQEMQQWCDAASACGADGSHIDTALRSIVPLLVADKGVQA